MKEEEGSPEILQVIVDEVARPDGTTGTFRSYLFIEGRQAQIGSEMPHVIGEGSESEQPAAEPRAYTAAETARRFQLLRGSKPKTPREEQIVAEDLANTERTLAKLESDGLRATRNVPKDVPPATW
jgi:hypothetical protein